MKTNNYLFTINKNLESILEAEIKFKYQELFKDLSLNTKIVAGGVEINISKGQFNIIKKNIKTAAKVYRRVEEKKCRDILVLEKILKSIPLNNYIKSNLVKLNIYSFKSRIFHENKIKEQVTKILALQNYQIINKDIIKEKSLSDSDYTELLIRIDNNILNISVNNDGKLYKRNKDRLIGIAPMRENIAAALFFQSYLYLEKNKTQFIEKPIRILDPFCGSGNILFESMNFFFLNDGPSPRKVFCPFTFHFLGQDIEEKKINHLLKLNSYNKEIIKFKTKDFFQVSKENIREDESDTIIITNPPFNKRIRLQEQKSFIDEFLKNCFEHYKAKLVCFIFPSKFNFSKSNKFYNLLDNISINYGGIDCKIYRFIPLEQGEF